MYSICLERDLREAAVRPDDSHCRRRASVAQLCMVLASPAVVLIVKFDYDSTLACDPLALISRLQMLSVQRERDVLNRVPLLYAERAVI